MPSIFEMMQADATSAPGKAPSLLDQMRADAEPSLVPQMAFAAPPQRPKPGYLDTAMNAVPKGLAGLLDMIPNALVNTANLGIAGYGVGKHLLTGSADLPEPIDPEALSGWTKMARAAGVIDPAKDPTDMAGRMIDFGGQVVGGGGVNPAALGRALARNAYRPVAREFAAAGGTALGGGAGSEAGRHIDTGNDALDTALRAGLTLGGGMTAGGFLASRGVASDRAAAALKGVTPEQLTLAKLLQEDANRLGAPLTGYEAIQGITGLNPKMQTQQRVVEQADAAGIMPMMQARPAANQTLFERAADTVAPPNPLPDALAGRLQGAAKGSLTAAREEGNALAEPFYAASSNDPKVMVPKATWQALTADPAVSWALEQTKSNPLLGVQGAQPGSLQWLDAAKKFLDSHANSQSMAGNNFPASQASRAATAITSAVDPVAPLYKAARSIVADNMKNNVEPMEAGQVGKLSRSDEFPLQAETLLPNKPMDVTPQVVDRTVGTINAQDPNIVRQFLAQYLRGQFNEANQQNMGGPNVFGGSKFAAQIAGNPAQEQNLVAALTASGASPQQMMEAIRIFRAQGFKPAVNSATTANAAESAALGSGVGNFIRNPISNTAGIIDWWRNGGASKELGKALAAPDSILQLEELARMNGTHDPTMQQLLANLLAAGRPPSGP